MINTRTTAVLAAAVLSILTVALIGCGNLSAMALRGVYIEGSSGNSMAFVLGKSNASLYMSAAYDKTANRITGTCLAQNMTYTLTGDTVRVEGGESTAAGAALSLFSDPGGGNVLLLHSSNDRQSLDLTTKNGTVITFVRQ